MGLLIKGGELVTADSQTFADVLVEGDTIRQIGPDLAAPPGTEIIDATGKLIFPGFIDPHVHIYRPFMSTFTKDTHVTASKAALVGGTTTFLEMICPSRNQSVLTGYNTWKEKADGNSACDYAFHMAVTQYDAKTEEQLRAIVADGATSFKVFLAGEDCPGITEGDLYEVLRLAADLGVVTAAHCENAELVARLQESLTAAGRTDPEWHECSRPEIAEAEGTGRFAAFLEVTGATGYVVHVSCAPALHAVAEAKRRGAKIYAEAIVPHLLLNKSYAERAGLEGMKYVTSPPLRHERNQPATWAALQAGIIDTVATGHAPFDTRQKALGMQGFTQIPCGLGGIEDRVNLMYTYGVNRGRLDLRRFVDALSTTPAKIFGLYPRKGVLAVGSDADIVVYDPTYRGAIAAARQYSNSDYNCFEGFAIEGRPAVVLVRGKVQAREGRFVGEQGRGKLLRRTPLHEDAQEPVFAA